MNELQNLWNELLGNVPLESQFRLWLATHRPENLREAIVATAIKNTKMQGRMDVDYRIKYCSSVANRLTFQGSNTARVGAR